MKQLTCEMCGSTDLMKQDGVFVCQTCGTKYSVEEAKKMMVEGTIDVQGTVKIDASEKLHNYYQVARRAKSDNDSETAAKYYSMILTEDPTSWEASFYFVYFRSMSCTIGQIPSAASAISKCLISVLTLAKQSCASEEDVQAVVTEIHEKAIEAATVFLTASVRSFVNIQTDNPAYFVSDLSTRSFAAIDIAYTIGTAIDKTFGGQAWAQKLVSSAYSTGNTLMLTYITTMKPRFFLEAAPIHYEMEKKANCIIAGYKRKIAENQEKQKKIYWEQHAEEKASLDQEKETLSAKVENWNAEISSLPEIKAEARIEAKIKALQQEKSALGFFKVKEKKVIQEQINNLASDDLEKAKASREAAVLPIQAQIDAATVRIAEIDEELTKER